MQHNSIFRMNAREALAGAWGTAILGFFLYGLTLMGMQFIPFLGGLGAIVISGPLALGLANFSLQLARQQETKIDVIFDGFQQNFERSLIAYLLYSVFVFLWSLLLIIPGIIKAIAYSQLFYILAEDPDISAQDALRKSEAMMYGHKWQYFWLVLSFIGWSILCILTLGIGYLWLIPYMNVSFANFYMDVKDNYSTLLEA